MKLINKSILTVAITLSTASVYYAQQVQDTVSKSKDIDEVILRGVTDIAKDRKTPVAVSTIKAAQILERQGNQELVELLNTTPSIYATKGGGGFGDSQITMRGFESRNIAVMVNGMPVNDMEGGAVYMSNWTGLSDVTSTMQVQRGLGSSKLAIASVGGTMNFITRSADMKQGGAIRLGIGNNDFLKTSFAYNTGKSQNGWSASFLASRQSGATYVQNTDYESYTYFFALGYQPSAKHNLQFMMTSSPQWHDQRSYAPTISNYIKYNPDHDGSPYRQYNSDYGYYTTQDGVRQNLANAMNYYSKPVVMLNWDWTMSEKSTLSTVAYMSNGRGGGARNLGKLGTRTMTNEPGFVDGEGHYNYDAIFAANALVTPTEGTAGNTLIRSSSVNSHNWYGILMNFQHKINDNWNFSIGTDDRYYYGYHYQVASDLYGAKGYTDNFNKNLPTGNIIRNTYDYQKLNWNPFGGKNAPMEDRAAFSNDGEVLWYSGFGQVEYTTEKLTAYVQGSVSNQGYQRIDDFVKPGTLQQGQPVERKTGFKNMFGYNIKGGANYNIDNHNNVFANIGYYSKQPMMSAVFPSNQQVINPTLTNEKIFSVELGYGFKTGNFNAKVNLYRTEWKDRWYRRGGVDFGNGIRGYSEISGITQLHQGAELEATYKVNSFLEFQGMFSWGDYKYKGNASGSNFQDDNTPIETNGSNTSTLYLDKVKVGGSNNSIPQTTASLGFTVSPVQDLRIYGNWQYTGRIYSAMNMADFVAPGKEALQLPDFNLFNVGASYKIKLKNQSQYFTLGVNVYNLLDTTYIQDGSTNIKTTDPINPNAKLGAPDYGITYEQVGRVYKGIADGNRVFFGFGRTWSTSLSFNF